MIGTATSGQDGGYWTAEEREKGVYVALRALRRREDPVQAVISYMGMTQWHAQICVNRAEAKAKGRVREQARSKK